MRRKLLFLLFFSFLSLVLFADNITLDYVGMRDGNVAGDYTAAPGATIYAQVQYDTDNMEGVTGYMFTNTNLNKVRILWYNASDPAAGSYLSGTTVPIIGAAHSGVGTNLTGSFRFTVPTSGIPTGAQSFQILVGMYGDDSNFDPLYGTRYTSYQNYSSYNAAGTPTAGWNGYIAFQADTATQTPTLTYPLDGGYDNASVSVRYTLPEAAEPTYGVHLYVDNDADHGSVWTDITLNGMTNASTYTFSLDGNDFASDSDVLSVNPPGNNALVNGGTYYMRIGYQDTNGNSEAYSGWHSFTYDTTINQPASLYAADSTGYYLRLGYTLPENSGNADGTFYNSASDTRKIVVIINNTSDTEIATLTLANNTLGTAGRHFIDLNGNSLSSTASVVSSTGASSLSDGTGYRFLVKYYDTAGNGPSTSSYAGATYVYDSTTLPITATPTLSQLTGVSSPTLRVGFQLPETSSNHTVHGVKLLVYRQADDVLRTTLTLTGSFNTATQTIDLPHSMTNGFVVDDVIISGVQNEAGFTNLINGNTYYIKVKYTDSNNNLPAQTSVSSSNVTWDGATATGINMLNPVNGTSYGPNLDPIIGYSLPETATSGSIKFYLYNDAAKTSLLSTWNLSSSAGTSASSHSHTYVDANNDGVFVDDSWVDVQTPASSLTNGQAYYIFAAYKDLYGNQEAVSSTYRYFIYDNAAANSAINAPASNTGDFVVTYTLPETAKSGTFKITLTRTDAAQSDIVLTMDGTACTHTGSGQALTLDVSNLDQSLSGWDSADHVGSVAGISSPYTLPEGTYTIKLDYTDIAENVAAQTSVTNRIFSTTAVTLTITKQDLNTGYPVNSITPVNIGGNNWRPIMYYQAQTNASTATISSWQINRTGTNVAGDFAATAFALIESSDTTLDAGDAVIQTKPNNDPAGMVFTGAYTVLSTSPKYYFFCVQPAATPTLGNTVGCRITASSSITAGSALIDAVGGFPVTEVNKEIAQQLTVTSTQLNQTIAVDQITSISIDSQNWRPIMYFAATLNGGSDTIASFKLDRTGANVESDFTANGFALYESSDATLDAGDDLIATRTYADGPTMDFTGSFDNFSGTRYYFFCVELSGAVTAGNTVGCSVVNATYVTNGNAQTTGTFAQSSSLRPLVAYVYAMGGGAAGGVIDPGSSNAPFFYFAMRTTISGTTTSFSDVTIAITWTADANDFEASGFQLYKSASYPWNASSATALGSALDFNSSLTFSSLGETLTDAYTYYYLTVDVANIAITSHNIGARITSGSDITTGYNQYGNTVFPIEAIPVTLPVELSSFSLTNVGTTVKLTWITQTENNNLGFNVYRGSSDTDYENQLAIRVNGDNLIPGAGNSSQQLLYTLEDNYRIEYDKTYWYWLETIELSGVVSVASVKTIIPHRPNNNNTTPDVICGLQQNFPNPFNPITTIRFALESEAETILEVYNVKGQFVKRLYHERSPQAGKYIEVKWDGRNASNKEVASGIYFYRLVSGGKTQIKQMMVLK